MEWLSSEIIWEFLVRLFWAHWLEVSIWWGLWFLANHLYMSYTLYVIAVKLKMNHRWMAWAPALNFYYMLVMAGQSIWLWPLMLIPVADIPVIGYVWSRISVERHHSPYWGIISIIPVINLIAFGYIAFADNKRRNS